MAIGVCVPRVSGQPLVCGAPHDGEVMFFDTTAGMQDAFAAYQNIVCHNCIGLWLPVLGNTLKATYSINLSPVPFTGKAMDSFLNASVRYIDTLLLSKLLCHSDDNRTLPPYWRRPQTTTGGQMDWRATSLDIDRQRCRSQCQETLNLFGELRGLHAFQHASQAYELEKAFAHTIVMQRRRGVCFDTDAARRLFASIEAELLQLEDELTNEFPRIEDSVAVANYLAARYGWVSGEWYSNRERYIAANARFGDTFVPKYIRWLCLKSRRDTLASANGGGWLNDRRVISEGRITAEVDTIGTITHRPAHTGVANVPGRGSLYGNEMRALFTASRGLVFVGWDIRHLEASMEAHEVLLLLGAVRQGPDHGADVHAVNATLFGCDRDTAKRARSAIVNGCSEILLARILCVPIKRARALLLEYRERHPETRAVIAELEREASENGGYITGIDGRLLWVKDRRHILSRRLQCNGAIVAKLASVLWNKMVAERGLNAWQVMSFHDELQAECEPGLANDIMELGVISARVAGQLLGLRVPLTVRCIAGHNWGETH